MVLDNNSINTYIQNNPNAVMVRINPQISDFNTILWLCQTAQNSINEDIIVQITTKNYSEELKAYIDITPAFEIDYPCHSQFIPALENAGFIIYTPNFAGNTPIINKFDELDLGISQANKIKFINCYNLLNVSYAQHIKPFKKSCVFAFYGLEGIFFWLMEKHVQLSVGFEDTEPVFIPDIDRDIYGLPKIPINTTMIKIIHNHVEHKIQNIQRADLELEVLHSMTQDIAEGKSVTSQYFTPSSHFGITNYTGYPLPNGVTLHEVVYRGKWNRNIVIQDILVEVR